MKRRARSQFSSSFGQVFNAGSFGAKPTPCRPCSYTCNSYGAFFCLSAAANIKLFSTATPASSSVWKKKVGALGAVGNPDDAVVPSKSDPDDPFGSSSHLADLRSLETDGPAGSGGQ